MTAFIKNIVVIFSLVFCAPIFAANVSVMIIETTPQSMQEGKNVETVNAWETSFLDVLFEEGHVASNAKSVRLEDSALDAIKENAMDYIVDYISEAKYGSVDYFILVNLIYCENQYVVKVKDSLLPSCAMAQVFRVTSGRCLWKEELNLEGTPSLKKAEQSRVRKLARSVVARLGESI